MSTTHAADVAVLPVAATLPWWKRAGDVFLASALLVLLLPLLLVLAAAVKVTSHGPVLYRQERFGLRGQRFEMIKFRTMYVDADDRLEDHHEIQQALLNGSKLPHDPRITTLGQDMRLLSLDELPQLWNVLRGDMSLIGPRPLRYRFELDWYGDRVGQLLSVRPGMTGLWQVSGRNDLSQDQRVALDLQYVRNMGLSTDLSILWRTIRVVLFPRETGAY